MHGGLQMQFLFFGLTFIENDAFIRTDSLVALCGGATLLCRVTQFPGCALQNLRGGGVVTICGGTSRLSALLHFCTICAVSALMMCGAAQCISGIARCTNLVPQRCCCRIRLSQYKVQQKIILCGKAVLCS